MLEKNRKFYILAFLKVLLLLLISSILILAAVPPVSRDALIHHLVVPKLYLQQGSIYEIPTMIFSYFPMNLQFLYMVPLYFKNDIVPKFIHFGFAVLTAWLIYGYLKRRINAVYGLIGVIILLSLPIIVKLSITVYVDLGLMFFSTASLLYFLKWVEKDFDWRFLIIAAFFCGLAMGTKYSGLIILIVLSLFTPFLHARYTQGERSIFRSGGNGLLFVFMALLIFSPWMIRNYIWTDNPIYPLFNHWFISDVKSEETAGLFAYRRDLYHESWWQIALIPIRIFFQGEDGSPQYFDGKLNPFLLCFTFFAFYGLRKEKRIIRTEKLVMLSFSLLVFAFTFFSTVFRMRYISTIIPIIVILSVFGLKGLMNILEAFCPPNYQKVGRHFLFAAILFSFCLNGYYIIVQYRYTKPFLFLTGQLTRDEYIERYRPEYAVMKYANGSLPKKSRILFVFMGKRGYYCDREYIFDMINNKSRLRQLVKRSDNPDEIWHGLTEMGFSHLIMNRKIFNGWVGINFNERDKRLLAQFSEKYVHTLFLHENYGLFRLGSDSAISNKKAIEPEYWHKT